MRFTCRSGAFGAFAVALGSGGERSPPCSSHGNHASGPFFNASARWQPHCHASSPPLPSASPCSETVKRAASLRQLSQRQPSYDIDIASGNWQANCHCCCLAPSRLERHSSSTYSGEAAGVFFRFLRRFLARSPIGAPCIRTY